MVELCILQKRGRERKRPVRWSVRNRWILFFVGLSPSGILGLRAKRCKDGLSWWLRNSSLNRHNFYSLRISSQQGPTWTTVKADKIIPISSASPPDTAWLDIKATGEFEQRNHVTHHEYICECPVRGMYNAPPVFPEEVEKYLRHDEYQRDKSIVCLAPRPFLWLISRKTLLKRRLTLLSYRFLSDQSLNGLGNPIFSTWDKLASNYQEVLSRYWLKDLHLDIPFI